MKIGVVSFHPAFSPPRSGGELRLHHLYRRLSQEVNVEMVAPTYEDAEQEVVQHSANWIERRFPKPEKYIRYHHLLWKLAKFPECSGLVCSIAGKNHRELKSAMKDLMASCDIVIHEYPFFSNVVPLRTRPNQMLIYDAHNVEGRMARHMFPSKFWGRWARSRIKRLEKRLARAADMVFVCSEEDGQAFVEDYGIDGSKIVVIPNGVDIQDIRPCASNFDRTRSRTLLGLSPRRPACFFIGSFHPPNFDAVELVIRDLAPNLPEVDFLIAGKVCDAFKDRELPPNMRLLGFISDEQKQALYQGADIALNPMLGGSGTNLKMLDYLAAGLPVLSTTFGARGLNLTHRHQAMICDPDRMIFSLEEMLADPELCALLSLEARKHAVERFSWEAISRRFCDALTIKTGKRLILLNDYPINPPEGGGQVRIDAVARKLSEAGVGVTVLTLSLTKPGRHIVLNRRYEEINIPRSTIQRMADGFVSRLVGSCANDTTALLFTRWLTRRMVKAFRRELRTADAVMISHPYLEPLARNLGGDVVTYYDSHNNEHELKRQLYNNSLVAKFCVHRVHRAENQSTRKSRAVFCVSEENRRSLMQIQESFGDRIQVCANGVNCHRLRPRSRQERLQMRRRIGIDRPYTAIFLGSGHPPNRDAVQLIIDKVAPRHPRFMFLIVGSVNGWFLGKKTPDNVMFLGMVPSGVKDFLLEASDFALNPMLTGSGTSLKLFDYMAAGLPVLSTKVGARGLEGESLEAVRIAEPDQFAAVLRQMMANPEETDALRKEARRIAVRYFDWSVTLRPMVEQALEDLNLPFPENWDLPPLLGEEEESPRENGATPHSEVQAEVSRS